MSHNMRREYLPNTSRQLVYVYMFVQRWDENVRKSYLTGYTVSDRMFLRERH